MLEHLHLSKEFAVIFIMLSAFSVVLMFSLYFLDLGSPNTFYPVVEGLFP